MRRAAVHTALNIRQFLVSTIAIILTYALYSSDLAPSNFLLFPKIKSELKGMRFSDVDDVKCNSMTALTDNKEDEFERCLQQRTFGQVH